MQLYEIQLFQFDNLEQVVLGSPALAFFSIAWFLLLSWLFAQPYRKLVGL